MNLIKNIQSSLGFGAQVTSGKIARDRLSLMLVHQRNSQLLAAVDMVALQREVASVVQKYVKVAEDKSSHVLGIPICSIMF